MPNSRFSPLLLDLGLLVLELYKSCFFINIHNDRCLFDRLFMLCTEDLHTG